MAPFKFSDSQHPQVFDSLFESSFTKKGLIIETLLNEIKSVVMELQDFEHQNESKLTSSLEYSDYQDPDARIEITTAAFKFSTGNVQVRLDTLFEKINSVLPEENESVYREESQLISVYQFFEW